MTPAIGRKPSHIQPAKVSHASRRRGFITPQTMFAKVLGVASTTIVISVGGGPSISSMLFGGGWVTVGWLAFEYPLWGAIGAGGLIALYWASLTAKGVIRRVGQRRFPQLTARLGRAVDSMLYGVSRLHKPVRFVGKWGLGITLAAQLFIPVGYILFQTAPYARMFLGSIAAASIFISLCLIGQMLENLAHGFKRP